MSLRWCLFLGSIAVALLSIASPLCAQSGEEPLKLADTQLEPVKWADVAGWTADDHLAAFAAYQTSCKTFRSV